VFLVSTKVVKAVLHISILIFNLDIGHARRELELCHDSGSCK
jgi:hypothetical protein